MKLRYNYLYEQILANIFCEGIELSFLRKKHFEASALKKAPKTAEVKNKLKTLSKALIIHILNNNYKNILEKYFPNLLTVAGKESDNNFKLKLDAELLSNAMTSDTYKSFLKDIDDIIIEFSRRNNHQFQNLATLRTEYLLSY